MKAVFVHRNALLRDSGLDPRSAPDGWRLVPATLEAMRTLSASDGTLVFLYGCAPAERRSGGEGLEVLVRQVEAGGGRVDVLLSCDHDGDEGCGCWGERAGAMWAAARDFGLHLNECYLIGDGSADVSMAYAAGVRPIVALNGRQIESVLGRLPDYRGFPVATDLGVAMSYIGVEDEITRQLGHPREAAALNPPENPYAATGSRPTITVLSPLARGVQARLSTSRTQLRDIGRWLTFFVLGALGLSLGIAYLLTHLYRIQPFPEFVYYITLQFIPRPVRGALFIAWGLGVILLAVRSFYRSSHALSADHRTG